MNAFSRPYQDANKIQKCLLIRILSAGTEDKDVGLLSRVWVEVEAFKREMRGIPKLSSHSLQDLAKARSSLAKRLSHATPPSPYTEIEDAPEDKLDASTPPAITEP